MNSFKHSIKWAAFHLLKLPLLASYRRQLLSTMHRPEARNRIDNILYPLVLSGWLEFDYLKEQDPDLRVLKQSLVMGGTTGVDWAKEYLARSFPPPDDELIGRLSFREACPIFDRLVSACKSSPKGSLIIQIGASSGREIAWLAKQFPDLNFFGTDIFQSVVDFANSQYSLQNLSFFTLSAKDIHQCLAMLKHQKIIIFSSGSLQYVQPEHLAKFFKSCNTKDNQVEVHLLEPANDRSGQPDALKGSKWRGNFSFTHNYSHYAKMAGFEITTLNIIRPYLPAERFPESSETVHFDMSCKN